MYHINIIEGRITGKKYLSMDGFDDREMRKSTRLERIKNALIYGLVEIEAPILRYSKIQKWDRKMQLINRAKAKQIADMLPENGIFIDIGANTGSVAEEVLRYKKECTAYLFEPIPEYCDYIKKKFKNRENIYINCTALGGREGNVKIFKDEFNLGWNTLINEKATEGMRHMYCEMITFDKFAEDNNLRQIDVIKIDVEGAEYMVFEGMKKTLSELKKKPAIFLEIGWGKNHPYWDKEIEIFKWLMKIGYNEFDYNIDKTEDIILYPK